ncbi:glycosyltransferase [Patescibacteria group bacterium]|nr:glycosyltransferase [Patescibacteria group bacterium]
MKNISIVIPSYKGVHLYEKNLQSVLDCMRDKDELVVVDDASGPEDDTIIWFEKKFNIKLAEISPVEGTDFFLGEYKKPNKTLRIILLVNQTNQRFGASSNRGFAASKYNLVFLINNDVAPYDDCLKYLIPHFEDKKVFAVGCLEHETHLNEIGGRNKLWFERGMFLHSRYKNLSAGETAWASGGSAMFRKSIFERIGGFDKLYYPAYWEDIDLSFQARRLGYSVLFEPKAQVDHNHETTNKSVFGEKKMHDMSWNNAKKFTWKNGNLWQKISFLLWQPYWFIKMR